MKEELISFETAKLAKEKGFIEHESGFYFNEKGILSHCQKLSIISLECKDLINKKSCFCTTQSLLQRWLRETYKVWIYCIPSKFLNSKNNSLWSNNIDIRNDIYFTTYEEALECGLIHGLNLIK